VYASDLNPVAVLITKALVEIPSKFAGRPPVHPKHAKKLLDKDWQRAEGLAEDVRYYGKWMRDEAEGRIGHLYPKVKLPKEHGGGEGTVIAWLWARTVKCPNPACGAEMPLVRSFDLSKKKGKRAWVVPTATRDNKAVSFAVSCGDGPAPKSTVARRGARCVVCESPVDFKHIRSEAKGGRMGTNLMAVVAKANRGRAYFSPSAEHERVARSAEGGWYSEGEISHWPGRTNVVEYGMTRWGDLFTPRQLVALTTFSDLVKEAREKVKADAVKAGMADNGKPLVEGGTGTQAYADAVAVYLALGASKLADYNSTIVIWSPGRDQAKSTFARQAIPMTWDYAEVNPLADAAGDPNVTMSGIARALERLPQGPAVVSQVDAAVLPTGPAKLVCTDPPYYDNIGYAGLSDFFYVWLRRSLVQVYPDLFKTLLAPKAEELIASPYRFDGSREKADQFFEEGLRNSFVSMRAIQAKELPLTVFYAFKQTETGVDGDRASTGWETMLQGLIVSELGVTATWPIRSERGARSIAIGANALASSVVLACRSRSHGAPRTTRRELLAELKSELPNAIRMLQQESIAPVDLAQAAIGPGMAIFSRYNEVMEADGSKMSVRTALALINETLDEILAAQEADFDPDTRWALVWYEQYGVKEALYGDAETLARAKNVSVKGLEDAGVLIQKGGKVRLLSKNELDEHWDPVQDARLADWEVCHHLILRMEKEGEAAAAELLRTVGPRAATARELAYRLYQICERKGWAQEAIGYNSLVVAWPEIARLAARTVPASAAEQPTLSGLEG
jgi:putative DNA methylase